MERAVLRGPRPKKGTGGLAHALTTYRTTRDKLHPRDPRKFVSPGDLDAADALVKKLGEALAPLESMRSLSTLNEMA
jgi:ATP-dependent helicase/nuclease subunit B